MVRALCLLLLLSVPGFAQTTLYVDCNNACPGTGTPSDPFCRIQDAINAASNGDTIEVASCVYVENLDFRGKAITVRSASGATTTVIDGSRSGPVITFQSGETAATMLDGFTLTNGLACSGGGIFCVGSAPTIRNSTITGSATSGPAPCGNGGGVYAGLLSAPTLENVNITSNSATFGGGVAVLYGLTTIEDSTISGNRAQIGGGLYFAVTVRPSSLVRASIRGNTGIQYTGGVQLNAAQVAITSSTISSNQATLGGGGIDLFNASDLTLSNSQVDRNITGSPGGGGLYCFSGIGGQKASITSSTFSGNTGMTAGGAIYSLPSSGIGTAFQIRSSIFWGDSPTELSIGGPGDSVLVEYCDVQGGYPGTGNISSNPLFVDDTSGDYRLQCSSPCIGVGPSPPPAGLAAFDHEGLDERVIGTIDIGADERGHDWQLQGVPTAGGPPVSFSAQAHFELNGLTAEVLLSSGEGGTLVPSSGGRSIGLDQDGTLNVWCSLFPAMRQVSVAGCGGVSSSPVSVPASVPVGTRLFYAGLAFDSLTGQVTSVSETRSFVVR